MMQNHVGTMIAQSLHRVKNERTALLVQHMLSKLNALAWIVSDSKILQSRLWDEKPQNIDTCIPQGS